MVATPSWPGLSGPSVAEGADRDGQDKLVHDGIEQRPWQIVSEIHACGSPCAGHDTGEAGPAKLVPIGDTPGMMLWERPYTCMVSVPLRSRSAANPIQECSTRS